MSDKCYGAWKSPLGGNRTCQLSWGHDSPHKDGPFSWGYSETELLKITNTRLQQALIAERELRMQVEDQHVKANDRATHYYTQLQAEHERAEKAEIELVDERARYQRNLHEWIERGAKVLQADRIELQAEREKATRYEVALESIRADNQHASRNWITANTAHGFPFCPCPCHKQDRFTLTTKETK